MANLYAVTIEANRNGYTIEQIVRKGTMTVKDLIDYLQDFDEDMPVVISNDNGYTYGTLSFDDINEDCQIEDEEEEDE